MPCEAPETTLHDDFETLGAAAQHELRSSLLHFATRRSNDVHLAEDAVQETLTAMVTHRQGEGAARTMSLREWLFGVLRHKIVDQFRRHTCERPCPTDELDTTAQPEGFGTNPDDRMVRTAAHTELHRAVMDLSETLSTPLVLHDFLGLPSSVICRRLAINKNALYVRFHRARCALRLELTN